MIYPFLVVCLAISGVSIPVHGFQDTLKENLELERQLKLINKPPIKTINTKNGDIVDWIDIYKQLAFDHPLLKDHKLQLAELALSSNFSPYYGVRGRSSVYNPPITKGQMSLSHVWVQNGPISSNNKISFGWQVSLDLYSDNKTHLYASWTRDNFQKTGCYNVRCPGFVQTSTQLSLGAIPGDISSYGGPVFDSTEYITMDTKTKNWWVHTSGEDVGYFPAKLFSNLASADKVGWGGRTLTPHGSRSPQMGSGHFPDKDLYL
ncbi:uncharacterized protein LOC108340455 isoform X3 [Vigna angularis]|uniref:uncharacterized protein LOC108340455 isoform X3 n=1 Tax=Phaseolus angularis TaxID=3914 RepID=UPI00080A6443|nr:uncharacterized protein LOC108340455 isoform X3 [Vigna angularis]